jgi:two-component system, NarL family, nitrate/nitrite response regulator NarL
LIDADGHYDEVNTSIRFFAIRMPDCKIVIIGAASVQIDFARILSMAPDSFILNIESRDVLLKALELALLAQQAFVLGRHPKPLFFNLKAVASNVMVENASGDSARDASVATASVVDPLLSARERQVLDLLMQGKANKTIARECTITEATVKAHLKAILRKINVRNRTEAAVWAIANGYGSGGLRVETIVAETARNLQGVENSAETGRGQGLSGV